MDGEKKIQLDMFGKHKEIEVEKKAPKKASKQMSNMAAKTEFIADYDEAIGAIKNNYESFLKVHPLIRAKLEVKDLAFKMAWEQERDDWRRQYFLLEKVPSSIRHTLPQGLNDDDYLTLKVAKVTRNNVSYMGDLSSRLRNDIDFFKSLYNVRPNNFHWDYLEYAGHQITANKDIVKMAVKVSSSEFKYIHSSLATDYSFLASLFKINHDVIEYYDRLVIENTIFLEELTEKLREKARTHSYIKSGKKAATYELVKKELEEFILSHRPTNLEDVMTIFASLNITFDYKHNKSLGSPDIIKDQKIKTHLRSLLKDHLQKIDYGLDRDTNYEDEEPEVGDWTGTEFTEFEQELIDIVNQDVEIPEEYFLDKYAAALADGFDQENIGHKAILLDVVDEENSGKGFFAAYCDETVFWEHASCYISPNEDFNTDEILDHYSFVRKNTKPDVSIINSYLLRIKGKSCRWYGSEELEEVSERLPELLWEILDSIYDEIYYCNNFGTLAKVLGASGPDMWQSSIHCLVCKKGEAADFMTTCVSV